MSFIIISFLFLLTGFITGILSSLMGIGGGLVVVPIMYLYLRHIMHLPEYIVMHLAVGTSLAIMIITTLNSTFSHARHGNIIWNIVCKIAPFLAIGSLIGSIVSQYLHSDILRYIFILFLIYVIAKAIFKRQFMLSCTMEDICLPGAWIISPIAFIVGALCVFIGISGSPITIPLLRKYKMPMRQATAIAVAIAPAVAILGTIGYIYTGWHFPHLPDNSFSFIYIPAFIGISIGSIFGVPIGTKISQGMSDRALATGYIVMLAVILLIMLV